MPKRNAAAQRRRRRQTTSKELDWKGLFDWNNVNQPLFFLSLGLFVFGSMMVASASVPFAVGFGVNPIFYFLRQIIFICLGLVGAVIIYVIPLDFLPKLSIPAILVSIILLIVVLFVGEDINGARRWIDLGPFLLQPSEVAKLGFTLYLSAWLARKRKRYKTLSEAARAHFLSDLLPFLILLGIIAVLIILQPDLDTAVIIGATALVVYFVSGKDFIHTLGTAMIVVLSAAAGVLAAVLEPYRLQRVQTFLQFLYTGEFSLEDRLGSAYQVQNSLISIAEGGLFGKGFGQSTGKSYLSEASFTDSIFAVVAEEFGFVGSLILILAFLYFMNIGINIAQRAPSKFSALLAVGITTWITLQAFLNIGANLAVIPFGGIPLPFISYGGSSTLVVFAGVAMLMNIHRHSKPSN